MQLVREFWLKCVYGRRFLSMMDFTVRAILGDRKYLKWVAIAPRSKQTLPMKAAFAP